MFLVVFIFSCGQPVLDYPLLPTASSLLPTNTHVQYQSYEKGGVSYTTYTQLNHCYTPNQLFSAIFSKAHTIPIGVANAEPLRAVLERTNLGISWDNEVYMRVR
jgi:hypothetical protein